MSEIIWIWSFDSRYNIYKYQKFNQFIKKDIDMYPIYKRHAAISEIECRMEPGDEMDPQIIAGNIPQYDPKGELGIDFSRLNISK